MGHVSSWSVYGRAASPVSDCTPDSWLREIAPTAELRTWYAHDVNRWPEFVTRYTAQLDAQPDLVASLLETARHGPLTLLFAARDPEHSSATVLLDYLEDRLRTT
jgi:uncharacterized protein YeaO (DUF488 family)